MKESLVKREQWLAAREELLQQEKHLTRLRDQLAAKRRELPMVKVEKDYRFQSVEGEKSLSDLFDGSKQLIVYHFMFGPNWDQGCPSCSFWADHLNGIDFHLRARDSNLVLISNASLEKLRAYQRRLGWNVSWVSAEKSSFNADFAVSFHGGDESDAQRGYNYSGGYGYEELPGISVFYRLNDGGIAHSYSTFARGIEAVNGTYQLLDMTPLGRQEDELSQPMAWVKRADEYSRRH